MALKKKRKKIGGVNVTLPTQKSKQVSNLSGYTTLIYGEKKIGKTSMLSHFENAIFLMFEPGDKALSVYSVHVKRWKEFQAYVDLLVKDTRFDTIIIDPVDICYDYCADYVCNDVLHISDLADLDWGTGWRTCKKEFYRQINRLLMSGKGVFFVSHQKTTEIKMKGGGKYSKITSTMSGQAKEVIDGMVDIWGSYDYSGEKRIFTIMGDDFIDAGNRLNEPPKVHFQYTDGTFIREIDMGNNSKQAYQQFMKAFNNELEREVKNKKRMLKRKPKLKLKRKLKRSV